MVKNFASAQKLFLKTLHVPNITMMMMLATAKPDGTSNMLYPKVTRQLNTDITCDA
jgi:hypothetical protein